jgi:hypothetical protein
MKYYGKAEEVAARIVEAFKSGNLPKALATVFIRKKDGVPCREWSWNNQLLCILNGTEDARGIKQWNEVGRKVKKGSKCFHILVPLMKTIKETDPTTGQEKKRERLCGFGTAPVFALESTEGAEIPKKDEDVAQWLDSLPFIKVARSWGLDVDAFNGLEGKPHGKYVRNTAIALAVKNYSTWAHELIHAADDRLGNLKETGQHWRSETVAELGGAILLEATGHEYTSDRGACFEYIRAYAMDAGIEPVQACMTVLKRTCDAVNLLLSAAEKLTASSAVEAA